MTNYTFKGWYGSVHTSDKELKDLLIGWILVSLAFAIARTVSQEINFYSFFSIEFIIFMFISGLTVGIAFIFHELAHKIVAQKYHCWAEFRADLTMLGFGILISFLGVVFIAPGAVMIFGHIDYRQNGKISLAGPLTNIILAILLFPLLFIEAANPIISQIITSGYLINAWLALFNMIPFWQFDGAKIYAWNKTVYFITLATAAILVFLYAVRL